MSTESLGEVRGFAVRSRHVQRLVGELEVMIRGDADVSCGGWVGGVMRRIIAMFTVAVAGFAVVPQIAVGALTERVSVATGGTQANNEQLWPGDQRRRALRGLRVGRVEPRPRRHEPQRRRVRARSAVGHHRAGQRGHQRHPGQRRQRYSPAISADGRYVAFVSGASNLVPGDTNTRTCSCAICGRAPPERVSVATGGTQANGGSYGPAISADGRYVAFVSDASNLVPGDTNDHPDVFVRDRRSGTTERVSVATDGTQANSVQRVSRRSAPTGATWPSRRTRRTSSPATRSSPAARTTRRRVRARSAVGHHPAGQRGHRRHPGQQRQRYSGDQRRRALRGLRVGRVEPRSRRHEPQRRRVRARSAVGHHPAGQRGHRRHPGQTAAAVARRSAPTGATWPSTSDASNLVPGDTNHTEDVFVRDLKGAPPPPSNKFTVSRIKTEADGTITFSVRVPGPGSVDVLETAWNDNFAPDPAAPWCSSPPRTGLSSPANTYASAVGELT